MAVSASVLGGGVVPHVDNMTVGATVLWGCIVRHVHLDVATVAVTFVVLQVVPGFDATEDLPMVGLMVESHSVVDAVGCSSKRAKSEADME